MPAVLLALGATLVLRSVEGERAIALTDFLLGPFTTALDSQELITDIVVPAPEPGSGSAYVAVEHPASGFALAGAAALVGPAGEAVAVTGIAGTPFLLPDGAEPAATIADAEVFGDRFAPEEYRRHLAVTCTRRATELARTRAAEDVA
jgi:carbon-monoxide dehydrogenase medium subunit